jgi:hypothetical protein
MRVRGSDAINKPDHWQRRLLRAPRAATQPRWEQRDELAALI